MIDSQELVLYMFPQLKEAYTFRQCRRRYTTSGEPPILQYIEIEAALCQHYTPRSEFTAHHDGKKHLG